MKRQEQYDSWSKEKADSGNYNRQAFKKIYLFILRERERQRERKREQAGEGQREGERESQAGSTLLAQSPMRGSISQTVRS